MPCDCREIGDPPHDLYPFPNIQNNKFWLTRWFCTSDSHTCSRGRRERARVRADYARPHWRHRYGVQLFGGEWLCCGPQEDEDSKPSGAARQICWAPQARCPLHCQEVAHTKARTDAGFLHLTSQLPTPRRHLISVSFRMICYASNKWIITAIESFLCGTAHAGSLPCPQAGHLQVDAPRPLNAITLTRNLPPSEYRHSARMAQIQINSYTTGGKLSCSLLQCQHQWEAPLYCLRHLVRWGLHNVGPPPTSFVSAARTCLSARKEAPNCWLLTRK